MDFRSPLAVIGAVVLVLILIVGTIALAFALELGGLKWKEFFAPKHADVDRKVFERTKSYNEGKEQELIKYRLEYMRAKDPGDKEALASTIRHAFADYDDSLLDPELQEFLRKIKRGEEYNHDPFNR
jgi:hypothetical protein